jgi:hypothetical protein
VLGTSRAIVSADHFNVLHFMFPSPPLCRIYPYLYTVSWVVFGLLVWAMHLANRRGEFEFIESGLAITCFVISLASELVGLDLFMRRQAPRPLCLVSVICSPFVVGLLYFVFDRGS